MCCAVTIEARVGGPQDMLQGMLQQDSSSAKSADLKSMMSCLKPVLAATATRVPVPVMRIIREAANGRPILCAGLVVRRSLDTVSAYLSTCLSTGTPGNSVHWTCAGV